jgi:hypothetical protein
MNRLNKISFAKTIFILFLIMTFAACGSKTSTEMSSKSPEGQTIISINGNKPSFGDPWNAVIKIKTSSDQKELVTEIFASELNSENVKFIWEANDRCRVTFIQQDDTKKNLLVEADSSHITYALQEE